MSILQVIAVVFVVLLVVWVVHSIRNHPGKVQADIAVGEEKAKGFWAKFFGPKQ